MAILIISFPFYLLRPLIKSYFLVLRFIMKKNPGVNLDYKYSKSAQKIKSIL